MTGSDPTPPRPTRPGRGWRVALVASLALNLLFVGLIAGGAMSAAMRPPPGPPGPDMRALWRALPDDSRQELRARFHGETAEARRPERGNWRARAAERDAELLALLRAEEFDAQAFGALLESLREASAARAASAQALLVERISELDPAQRAALADRYENRRARGVFARR
jgi:uncharacterized membrane protein